MPEIPQEVIDMVGANPDFAETMSYAMDFIKEAVDGGISPADAFSSMGDMMGAAIGPAMHMAPADASPADMGAMMQDGMDMMMPEGVDCPPAIKDAMDDIGSAMGDAGMSCHDVGAEMMGDPGSDTYMLPTDADGGPIVDAGQPETCPADACQAPPKDGACASTDMMPPEGGYNHAPMQDEFVMPSACLATMDFSAMACSEPEHVMIGFNESNRDDNHVNLSEVTTPELREMVDAANTAIFSAMDAATEQVGGAPITDNTAAADAGAGVAAHDEVDPSAGMRGKRKSDSKFIPSPTFRVARFILPWALKSSPFDPITTLQR
jgi:hypothetical protein